MEYLLVMAISGSTMTVLYLLTRRLLREKLCARPYYLLAKAAALYYLIPLPFLKSWYRDMIPRAVWERRRELKKIPLTWTSHTIFAQGDMRVNAYAAFQITVAVVWLLGVCTLLARRVIAYARITRRFAGYAETEMTDSQRTFIDGLKREYGVRRRVSFLRAHAGEATVTFGIFRPVIICGKDTESREAELLARHEMVHIKRVDVLWKILMEFAASLHWWNPLVWKLYRDFERVCEMSCDETVMRDKTKEEKKAYLRLLIEEAREEKPKGFSVRWKSGFGSNAQYIRERMDNLMRKHKWNRFVTGALVAALILANSMTVFAYRDGLSETVVEDVSEEDVTFVIDKEDFVFAPGGTDGDEIQNYGVNTETEILYERQFTDGDGNIYPVSEDNGIEPHCNHVYIRGEARNHATYSDGSWEVRIYDADRCSKCGHVIYYSLISKTVYTVCPHK